MILLSALFYIGIGLWACIDEGKPQEIVTGRKELSKEEYVAVYFFYPIFLVIFVIKGLYRGLFPPRYK